MVEPRDADARFRGLYDEHHRAIHAYFLRRVDRLAAQDCTGRVFAVAWSRFDQIPGGERGRLWLYGVARNVLNNHLRSIRRRSNLISRLSGVADWKVRSPEDEVFGNAERTNLLTALQQLSERDQELLRLAYWEELHHKDIAELLGCSPSAVDVRLHRARRRLAKGLEQIGHVPDGRPAFLEPKRNEE